MSAVGDAMTALKNVILMQERIQVLQKEIERVAGDVSGLNDYCMSLDKRVVRIETMIEMTARAAPSQPSRIEG